MESDNYLARHGCLDLFNLDILAVVETYLHDKDDLLLNYFQWYGHNRTDIQRKAKKGSGGVGFMIRKSLLRSFKCIHLDDSEEGILWLRLSAYECDFTMCVNTMYLPPEGTTRYVNPNAFYEALLSKILIYQDECDLFYLCGDINGCCGDLPDYIESVDPIPDRTIIDTAVNKYGELLCEFLLSTDCCILNEGNTSRNYYMFRDISVVDYCLFPHHKLDIFYDFSVRRTKDMFQNTGLLAAIGDPHHILPDHNLLIWTLDIVITFACFITKRTKWPINTYSRICEI